MGGPKGALFCAGLSKFPFGSIKSGFLHGLDRNVDFIPVALSMLWNVLKDLVFLRPH